ncbi:MAG TPA: malectin domain-containing carbohydrate-binding protein [Polyangia bacterium]|nr:malectin domain-containing carbohydrate-binding protein [Polyangia bacterium]
MISTSTRRTLLPGLFVVTLLANACGEPGAGDPATEALQAQLRTDDGPHADDGHHRFQTPASQHRHHHHHGGSAAGGQGGSGDDGDCQFDCDDVGGRSGGTLPPVNAYGALPADDNCEPSHMTLHGGQPMQGDNASNTVTLVPVIWGTNATMGFTDTKIDTFLSSVFLGVSPWFTWLKHEYHLPNIATKPIKRLAITAANASKTTISPADIQAEIMAHINDGTLPLSSNHSVSSMLYIIHLPSTVFTYNGGTDNLLCGGSDGKHWTSPQTCAYNTNPQTFTGGDGKSIHYIIMPDMTKGGCLVGCPTTGVAPWDNMTMVESHELAEALSDPYGGWYDSAPGQDCGQIADPCVSESVVTTGSSPVTVQMIWSNVASMCVGNNPGAVGDLGSLGTTAVVLAGDTDPGTTVTKVHYAQSGPNQSTNTALTARDATTDATWMAAQKTGSVLVGDFDGNGFNEVATVGGSATGITLTPNYGNGGTLFSTTSRFYTTSNLPELAPYVGANFPLSTTQTSIRPVTGDFNGDAAMDIALVGGPGWTVIPIAFGVFGSNGGFYATAESDGGFNSYVANNAGTNPPQLVSADFNGDGLADLALVGLLSSPNVGRSYIAVAYAKPDPNNRYRGYGAFRKVEVPVTPPSGGSAGDFNVWASTYNVTAVGGDFDGDGFGDIALTGGLGWASVPMAFSRGATGSTPGFTVVNFGTQDNPTIAAATSTPGNQVVAGDFDGNGIWDLAFVGATSQTFVGLGMSPQAVGSGQSFGGLYWDAKSTSTSALAAMAGHTNVYAAGATLGTPRPPVRINAGAGAVWPFAADANSSGGTQKTRTNTITTTGVPNPAPAAVYQSQRYGDFTYTFAGYTANSSHRIRLHFAETHWTSANQRSFNVSINGVQQISAIDIFQSAGGANKAYVIEFNLPTDGTGKYTIGFQTIKDAAFINGIEII